MIPAEAVEAAAIAMEDAALKLIGSDLGTIHRNDIARLALEAAAPYIAGAWHDAVSEAYVEGSLSLEQASVMWNKNPYRTPNAR